MTNQEESSNGFLDAYDSYSSESADSNDDSKPSKTSKTEQMDENEQSNEGNESKLNSTEDRIKDRKVVAMYLPEDVWRELDIRFDEINAKHKRKHGNALEKNRDYYPAVIQAGLTNQDLEDFLDL